MLPLIPLSLAILLSAHGLRKKSLSTSGAIAAFLVGFLMLGGATYVFGVVLIGFYLVGSRATKYGKDRKARLEDAYHEAGYRSGWQVLSNSVSALVAACLWNAAFAPTSIHARLVSGLGVDVNNILGINHPTIYSPQSWCPSSGSVAGGWSRVLVFASLGHFACCLGDTLASELGILSKSKPRLVTTLKPVPPGTNGAMSLAGTIASIAGGAFVGLLTGITLILENDQCRRGAIGYLLFETLAWGMFGGLFGSFVDSLLGATVQQTRYSTSKKLVLQDDSKDTDAVKVISGWNFLSNNQVNLVSSIFCAFVVGWTSR